MCIWMWWGTGLWGRAGWDRPCETYICPAIGPLYFQPCVTRFWLCQCKFFICFSQFWSSMVWLSWLLSLSAEAKGSGFYVARLDVSKKMPTLSLLSRHWSHLSSDTEVTSAMLYLSTTVIISCFRGNEAEARAVEIPASYLGSFLACYFLIEELSLCARFCTM